MRFFICYDIADTRRLRQVERAVSNVAQRIQDSLYEGEFNEAQIQELQRNLIRIIDRNEDSVRYYPICARDLSLQFKMATEDPLVCASGWVV